MLIFCFDTCSTKIQKNTLDVLMSECPGFWSLVVQLRIGAPNAGVIGTATAHPCGYESTRNVP